MFFSRMNAAMALVAVTVLSQVPFSVAGHVRGVGHHRRSIHVAHDATNFNAKRAGNGEVEIPLVELQQLQSEYAAFKGWVEAGFMSASSMDPATYMAQFKQEFTAYDGWMSAWLNTALSSGGSTPAGSVVPSSTLLPLSKASNSVHTVSVATTPTSHKSSSTSHKSSTTSLKLSSASHTPPSSSYSQPPSAFSPPPVSPPGSPLSSHTSASTLVPSASSSSAAPASSSNAPSTGGSFNAAASNNVAVYYGQSGATSQVPLSQLCSDPSVNIIVLAFLTTFSGPGGYPTLNFGSTCGGPSPAQTAAGATGLLSCPTLATSIQTCQSAGKKVLLSLGGAEATTSFASDDAASAFATQLINLFTGGTDPKITPLRPFGSVKLDGFDIDNEDHSTDHYTAFTTALRTALDADTSKTYYISSAPQCPRPDASIPLDAMQVMDFVFVQFYNNGDCNVGASGFLDSFTAWSGDLSAKGKGPKLYIGAPACSSCAGSGYNTPDAVSGVIQQAVAKGVGNLGGVMLWDGAEAVVNANYQDVVKKALGGS